MTSVLEIGPTLAEARLRHGLSLEDVEAETRIRTRYLAAMEDERFEELPGEGYAKCFLRSYATFLGLDGPRTVAAFNTRYAPPEPAVPVTQVRTRRRLRPEPLVLLVVALAVAGGLAYLGVRLAAGSGDGPGPKAAAAAPAQTREPPAAETAPAAGAEPVAATEPKGPPPVLVLTARAPCWLEVRIGGPRGKLVWTGTLTTKSRLRFGLRKPLFVVAGAPDALQAAIGDRKAKLPAGVHRLHVTRKGATAAS